MNKKKRKPAYPDDFRHEVVRLVIEEHLSHSEVARRLDVPAQTVGNWVRQRDKLHLQYSNPNVEFIGYAAPSGETLRFNARTAYCLAPVMSGFRGPGQIIRLFWDDFEELFIPATGC